MKNLSVFILIYLSFLSIDCNDNSTSSISKTSYKVIGKVLSNGIPVNEALINIDNLVSLQTTTDSAGNFVINDVPRGEHNLKIFKESGNGSFLERNENISVQNDLILNSLILPKPVYLYEVGNITANSVDISWSATDASDFREYKLYQHTTSGLDETTGTLVHVSTGRNDTNFTVPNLDPLTEYFFRLYVMNDYGRLGGSNIVSNVTLNLDLIINGSFESINPGTSYPYNWQFDHSPSGYYFVDSNIFQQGQYSIRIENAPGVNIIYQIINSELIVPNTHYRLTYWIRHDQLVEGDEFAVFINNAEFSWHVIANLISGPKEASDWDYYEYDFISPNMLTANYSFGFYFYIENNHKAWLDNISLKKIM